MLFLIIRYGVNVPFADDFTLAPLLLSAHSGTLTFGELFAQHNEHRMALPRLLALGFARFAHGDLRVQMLFSFTLVVLTAALFWFLIWRTIKTAVRERLVLMLLLSMLLFSPIQAENWMWGFQVALFLNNLLLIAAVAVAVSAAPIGVKFVACVLFAALATYSFGSGVLLWALTFPLALFTKTSRTRRTSWAIAWALCAAGVIGCYFIQYQHPIEHSPTLASPRLTDYVAYVLAFLGAHLSSIEGGIIAPAVIGGAIVAVTVGLCASAWRVIPRVDLPTRVLPWAGLILYAGFNAALAAVTRISFGVSQALDSRYTSFSIYSSIGLLGVSAALTCYEPSVDMRKRRAFYFVALIALSIGAYSSGVEYMKRSEQSRLNGKAGLLFANVLDSGNVYETALRANQHDAKRFAQMLDSLGLLRPRMISTAHPAELKSVAADSRLSGYVDEIHCSGSSCAARGWAFLPLNRRTADAVVLSYGTGRTATLFQMTSQMHQRIDVAQLLRDPALLVSGWTAQIDREAVPAETRKITGWAVDSETATLYELRGAAALP